MQFVKFETISMRMPIISIIRGIRSLLRIMDFVVYDSKLMQFVKFDKNKYADANN